jgi:hypothetical protein
MPKFFRGWAIYGGPVYYQLWNAGDQDIEVDYLAVTIVSAAGGAVLLAMEDPLPTSLADFGAASGHGVCLDQNFSLSVCGELRAATGTDYYGAQLYNFTPPPNLDYRIPIESSLAPGRGLGIRIPGTGWTRLGFKWTEPET